MEYEGKKKILVVDDIDINREILKSLLDSDYEIIEAADGLEAWVKITKNFSNLSLILLDLMMPEMDGFQVMEMLKANNYTHIPVIIITANDESEKERRGFTLGAVDFISKPFDPDIVKLRVDTQVNLKVYRDHLESMVEEGINKMSSMWTSIIQTLADVIECRNQESGLHVKRTSVITTMLLNKLAEMNIPGYSVTRKNIRYISEVSGLHDIGKISIPDNILTAPRQLTNEEFEIMKTHTTIGEEIAEKITAKGDPEYKQYCREICRHHHEKWDGTGYPDRLSGEQIPLSARVVCISDAYDAMTNDRVYRKAFSHEKALSILKADAGKHFDPVVVEVFNSINEQIHDMSQSLTIDENAFSKYIS